MTQAFEDWVASAEQMAVEVNVAPEAPRAIKVILASLAATASLAQSVGLEILDLKAFLDQWEQQVKAARKAH